jgi:hypothetical protein
MIILFTNVRLEDISKNLYLQVPLFPSVEKQAKEVKLKVAEVSRQEDVGKWSVRIDAKIMEYLEVSPGDIVEIKGKRTTAAVVLSAYPEDAGKNIIRMDGITRKNAGVSIGGDVSVRKAVAEEAQSVTIAPVNVTIPGVDQSFYEFVKNRILEAPVVAGDTIQVSIFGSIVRFRVIKTTPHGIVVITPGTNVQVLSEPAPERVKDRKIQVWCVEDLAHLSADLEVREFEALFDGTVKVACDLHLKYDVDTEVATSGVLEFRWREEALSELDGFVNTLSRATQEELEKIKAGLAKILANVKPVTVDMDRLLNKLIEVLRNRIPKQNIF